MDSAGAFDQTKENIQPLAQGRKTLQFEAALHAQNNIEAHQELIKIAENYELALRTYDGDDPLAPWYEYICWVEQSFPKGGKEGNLLTLLEKCLTHFKDNKLYFQDGRFIRLWIKYIDGKGVGISRAELYRMAHCHGVGTQSTLFYRFWAYELERSGDNRSADAIYRMGLEHNAQPKEELVNAHSNFTASLAQRFLNGTAPSPQRPDASDRQVLAALRANNKNHVPNVRLGGSSARPDRRAMSLANNQIQHGTLKIFNDGGENVDLNVPGETMRSLPKQSVVNKENTLNAGPWTGPTRRKTQPAPSTLSTARQPAFQVHTDDLPSTPRELPRGSVMNALQPIKDEFFERVPCAVFEEPNPMQRCMYRKDEVYAGSKEFSLEELRVAHWFKKEAARKALLEQESAAAKHEAAMQARLIADQKQINASALKFSHHSSNNSVPNGSNIEYDSLDALQLSDPKKDVFSRPSSAAMKLSFSEAKHSDKLSMPPKHSRRKTIFLVNTHDDSSDNGPNQQSAQKPGIIGREPELRTTDQQALESRDFHQLSTKERSRELHLTSNESCSSTDPSMLHSQSITVNTKEAMSVMNELWGSTCDRVHQSSTLAVKNALAGKTYVVSAAALNYESEEEDVGISIATSARNASFTIFSDCKSQSNVRSAKSEFSVYATEHDVQSKENVAYSRRTISLTVHTDEEDDFVVQKPAKCIKNDFLIYQETDDAQRKDDDFAVQNPANSIKNDFVIYDESEDPLDYVTPWPEVPVPGSIPLVPSPGMTQAQIEALEGSEYKENITVEPPPEGDRVMAGILRPSIGIPFKPIDDSDPGEAGDERERLEPTEFFTQAFTQAFNFPLTSSTPFHGNFKMSPVLEVSETLRTEIAPVAQEIMESPSLADQEAHTIPARTPTALGPVNLSVIMENSKETYKSCSSSGSSSGATTRRTFSTSAWSTQESMQRTGREKSLAAIQERKMESLVETEGDHSSLPEGMEADVLSLEDFRIPRNISLTDNLDNDCKEDLITLGVFDLTCKKDELSENGDEMKRSKCLKNLHEEKHEKMFTIGNDEESMHQSYKKIETSFCKLELSESEPALVDSGNPLHLENGSQTNASAIRMKIFEDLFTDEPPKKYQSSPESVDKCIDPFDEELIADLLKDINFPGTEKRHIRLPQNMPIHWKPGSSVQLGTKSWDIAGMVGMGSYAKVVKGILKTENRCSKPETKALKIQKPSWVWELYISCQIHKRLVDKSLTRAFMEVDEFYEFKNGSVFTSEYIEFGTVLDVANKLHSPANIIKTMLEPIAMHFTMELLQIVEALHKCRIVHADIKPDNFLLRGLLTTEQSTPTLQLIDFGRAIDLTLFPVGTSFKRVVNTKGFKCGEMQSDRPWTYQTDLYGMASTAHCLLVGYYMDTVCQNGIWSVKKKMPRSQKSPRLWNNFFHTLLNVESCEKMPDLDELRAGFEQEFDKKKFFSSIPTFNNLVLDH